MAPEPRRWRPRRWRNGAKGRPTRRSPSVEGRASGGGRRSPTSETKKGRPTTSQDGDVARAQRTAAVAAAPPPAAPLCPRHKRLAHGRGGRTPIAGGRIRDQVVVAQRERNSSRERDSAPQPFTSGMHSNSQKLVFNYGGSCKPLWPPPNRRQRVQASVPHLSSQACDLDRGTGDAARRPLFRGCWAPQRASRASHFPLAAPWAT